MSTKCYWLITFLLTLPMTMSPASAAGSMHLQLGPPPESYFPEVRGFLEQLATAYNGLQSEVVVSVAEDDPDFVRRPVTREALGDIVFLSGARYGEVSTLAEYVKAGFLVPLDDRVTDPEFSREDYVDGLWEQVSVNGATYGVPLLARAWAIGVNTAYFDPIHWPSLRDGWSHLLDFMQSTEVDANADGTPDMLMCHTTKDVLFLWQILYLAHGGDPNDPTAFNAQSYAWKRATEETLAVLERRPALFAPFDEGHRRYTMYDHPVQFVHNDAMDPGALPLLQRRSPAWQLSPPPGDGRLPNLDSTVAAIVVSNPEQEAAAWHFLAWLSSAEIMAAVYPSANLVPLRRSVATGLESDSLRMFSQSLERMVFQRPFSEEHTDTAKLKEQLRSVWHD